MAVKLGDIVEVNGMTRIVTAVGPNYFVSEPYEKKIAEVEIEEIKPAKIEEKVIRRRGKKEK